MIADNSSQTETVSLDVNHVPLANRIAGRLQRTYSWVGLDDLRSYAYLGMALAAKAYESDRGVPFEQFAWRKGMFLAIDEMRKDGVLSRKRTTPGPSFTALTPEVPDPAANRNQLAVERRDLCRTLLTKLRTQDRHLLMMYYADQLTFKEIAKVFDISESAVCLRHKALLGRLRKLGRTAVA
ncbi:MAG: sigma-70 family RNA polymerase sigma factor [Planctomycetota bacterium]